MASISFDRVTKRFTDGTVAVSELDLEIAEGEFVILVGPSGCGKSTALRMTAGLETMTSGEIRIDGRRVNELEPSKRDIAMVFQNYALYPHMTVAENLGFPLRQQGARKPEIRDRVDAVAKLLDIERLLGRKPAALSGGQRQRVAIGRALVRRPKAFLMDEPLSNLDAKLRVQMRAELISLHRQLGITTIYVTHDQTEAMTLGDRVVVLRDGVVQQVDRPETLYRAPRNVFVAGFIGSPSMNLLEGQIAGGAVEVGSLRLAAPAHVPNGPVLVGVRPENLELDRADASGTLAATVALTEQLGPEKLAYLKLDGVESVGGDDDSRDLRDTVVGRFEPMAAIAAGDRVGIRLAADAISLFERESGAAVLATVA
jgi:multiple sugar transport system ATP-binding protein